MSFYERGRKQGDFEGGIRLAVQAILASPRFLFRIEQTPSTLKAGQTYRISDHDLASRLSFFIWGSMPDAELLKAASQGTLRTPVVFDKQLKRLLADPRSEALSTRFASQWLRLQDVEKVRPDHHFYSYWDTTLSQAMVRETELFVDSLIREDRPVTDLLTADHTFVNERLAKHYGIPNILGDEFRRVTIADVEPPRRARPGQRAAADLDRRSHLAGAARQVGDGSAARLAAAAAAAQRAAARRDQGRRRRQDAVDARAHGEAPQEPGVHLVPPRDRSARPGARELRRHRRVAHQATTASPSIRSAISTTAPSSMARSRCATRC